MGRGPCKVVKYPTVSFETTQFSFDKFINRNVDNIDNYHVKCAVLLNLG
jgi:hypothetical protein